MTRKYAIRLKKKDTLIQLAFGTVFLFCCQFSQIKEFSYIAILNFLFFLAYIAKVNPFMYVKYFALLFMFLGTGAGVIVAEFDSIYLYELATESRYAGSLPLLMTGFWMLFATLLIFEKQNNFDEIRCKNIKLTNRYIKLVNTATLVVLILFLIVVFYATREPPAFALGIDRFLYAMNYSNKMNFFVRLIVRLSPLLLLFPLLSISYGNKIVGSITVGLYILYMLWTGSKFGSFFTMMCVFLLINYESIKNRGLAYGKRVLTKIGIIFAGLIICAVVINGILGGNSAGGTYYLWNRVAQQGQEWWRTYNLYHGSIHPSEFRNEINAIINPKKEIEDNIGSQYGIYKIMYLTTPAPIVNLKLATGSRYTEAGYACAFYYFGSFGVIFFSVVMGVVIAATINGFIKAFNDGDILKMLLLVRLFNVERTALSMFTFYVMFDVFSIITYLILFFGYKKSFIFDYCRGKILLRVMNK